MTSPFSEFAPAKINLTLHVTGRREDGYHLLDSLVVFADMGDRLDYTPGGPLRLEVVGPRAHGVPTDARNLVLKAAQAIDVTDGAVRLTKTLPAAAGIGGGSADAAAALRLFEKALDRPRLATPETLGADVPACLLSRSLRMQGVGEHLTELPNIPPLWAILVNPGVEVATPDVFANLQSKENASHGSIPKLGTSEALITWLHEQRNDLEPPAIAVQPIIADILGAISALPDCQLARMSGSGATCFGLFPSEAAAVLAALLLQKDHPNWWVVQTRLGAAP